MKLLTRRMHEASRGSVAPGPFEEPVACVVSAGTKPAFPCAYTFPFLEGVVGGYRDLHDGPPSCL